MPEMLRTYDDFTRRLDEAGFMTLSRNPAGCPNLSELTEDGQWHTSLDTDPWQWKSRVVAEGRAAYAKLFHGLPSFVTRQWYPMLLAARRGGGTFKDVWDAGVMSPEAKRIYDLFSSRSVLAVHEIKRLGGFSGQSAGRYERAMAALQAGMYLTVSGMTRMTTLDGRPHSWPVTEYMRVDDWAWPGVMERAAAMDRQEAVESTLKHLSGLIPGASKNKLLKFIGASYNL